MPRRAGAAESTMGTGLAPAHPGGSRAWEQDVAMLVARGLSNGQKKSDNEASSTAESGP